MDNNKHFGVSLDLSGSLVVLRLHSLLGHGKYHSNVAWTVDVCFWSQRFTGQTPRKNDRQSSRSQRNATIWSVSQVQTHELNVLVKIQRRKFGVIWFCARYPSWSRKKVWLLFRNSTRISHCSVWMLADRWKILCDEEKKLMLRSEDKRVQSYMENFFKNS